PGPPGHAPTAVGPAPLAVRTDTDHPGGADGRGPTAEAPAAQRPGADGPRVLQLWAVLAGAPRRGPLRRAGHPRRQVHHGGDAGRRQSAGRLDPDRPEVAAGGPAGDDPTAGY